MEDHSRIVKGVWIGLLALGLGAVWLGVGGGCSAGSSRFSPSGNPLLDIRNPELLARDRVAAAERAWAEVESGVRVRGRTREAFKSLAWSGSTDEAVRLTLIRLLMSDETYEGTEDSLNMARLMLPTERSPEVTRELAQAAVDRGWVEAAPALIRSYARATPGVGDESRIERAALTALYPGVSVEETVYGVFLRPSRSAQGTREGSVLQAEERTRDDAWSLLSRLDTDGRVRARLIGDPVPDDADPGSARDVETLRAGLRELGALPRTGTELAWLRRLHRHDDPELRALNGAWWSAAASAIAGLSPEQRTGLQIRHAEAVRWASVHRPAWLGASRHALLDEMAGRLAGRGYQRREGARGVRPRSERLADWRDSMSWADALAVLVVDEVISKPAFVEALYDQVELDRNDTSTEYGGVIDAGQDDDYRIVLFRPRARDRTGDDRFVASTDMIRFSDRALVHYHLQVQRQRMGRQAGPSDGDLLYAADSGRACLVFTSVASDQLNVDYYTPDGVVIDLGLIQQP